MFCGFGQKVKVMELETGKMKCAIGQVNWSTTFGQLILFYVPAGVGVCQLILFVYIYGVGVGPVNIIVCIWGWRQGWGGMCCSYIEKCTYCSELCIFISGG